MISSFKIRFPYTFYTSLDWPAPGLSLFIAGMADVQ